MKKQINFKIPKSREGWVMKRIRNPEKYGCKVTLTFEDKDGNIYRSKEKMKLYIVIGIEYYSSSELLGIYSTRELAEKRKEEFSSGYDEIKIKETELNKDI